MILNLPFVTRKTETIDFKAFMKRQHRKDDVSTTHTMPLLSIIPLNPAAMIDPVFIGIGAGIILLALFEKGLANSDHLPAAAFISAFLRLGFPVAGMTALWHLIGDLKFLFW